MVHHVNILQKRLKLLVSFSRKILDHITLWVVIVECSWTPGVQWGSEVCIYKHYNNRWWQIWRWPILLSAASQPNRRGFSGCCINSHSCHLTLRWCLWCSAVWYRITDHICHWKRWVCLRDWSQSEWQFLHGTWILLLLFKLWILFLLHLLEQLLMICGSLF